MLHPLAALDDLHSAIAAGMIVRPAAQLPEIAQIDFLDDLGVARQDPAHEVQRPDLERFGHKGVIGIGEHRAHQVPGLVPFQPVLVDQEPHEFGRGERRVGVVEVDGPLVRQQGPVAVAGAERGQQVLDRGGDEEMLLAQPEFAPFRRAVVGIEDARQGLAVHLAGLGVEMGPAVEGAEIEGVDRLDAP
jgi:hypothetical protein